MSRTSVRSRRLGLVLVSAAVTVALAGPLTPAGTAAGAHPERLREYVIRPGDTLWSIAKRLVAPDEDPRPVVDAIVRANHVSSTLMPGRTLLLPQD